MLELFSVYPFWRKLGTMYSTVQYWVHTVHTVHTVHRTINNQKNLNILCLFVALVFWGLKNRKVEFGFLKKLLLWASTLGFSKLLFLFLKWCVCRPKTCAFNIKIVTFAKFLSTMYTILDQSWIQKKMFLVTYTVGGENATFALSRHFEKVVNIIKK